MPRSELSTDASVQSFATYSEDTATSEEVARRRPKKYKWHKKFAYQKLRGWRPILAPRIAELFFASCGVLLIALGVPILVASLNVVEYKVPYGFEGPFAGRSAAERQQLLWAASDSGANGGVEYPVSVLVDKRMEPPIYVAFELGTYFQNFRRYVRSYDPARMHDGSGAGGPVSACQPFSYLDGNTSLPINPCGQIAHSFFNDTFRVFAAGPDGASSAPGAELAVDDSDIAWPSDRKHLYGDVPAENYNTDPAQRGGNTSTVALNQNQHWMVWMRPHSQVAIQKLYGRIDSAIEAGTNLTILVSNKYNTYEFSGDKSVIISTNSWVGGRNVFLGAVYLAVGGLCLITALFFFAGYDLGLIWKRPVGDLANLSWLRRHAAELHSQQQFAAASSNGRRVDGSTGSGSPGGRAVQVQAYQEEEDAAAAGAPNPSPPKN